MVDQNLTELTATTTLVNTDIIYVVTGSGTLNRKITYANLLTEIGADVTITASRVSDFEAAVTANASVTANTAKISFDNTSSTRLANTSGTNTGDQDLSGKQDNIILTTSGSSGAATLTGATLNIPQYTGGASNLSELSDVDASVATPSDGDILVYRSAGTDWILEAKPVSSGSPAWGDITGTLSAQTDLNSALGTKLESSDIANFETTTQLNARDSANRDRVNHTGAQAISTVTNLQTALDGKIGDELTGTSTGSKDIFRVTDDGLGAGIKSIQNGTGVNSNAGVFTTTKGGATALQVQKILDTAPTHQQAVLKITKEPGVGINDTGVCCYIENHYDGGSTDQASITVTNTKDSTPFVKFNKGGVGDEEQAFLISGIGEVTTPETITANKTIQAVTTTADMGFYSDVQGGTGFGQKILANSTTYALFLERDRPTTTSKLAYFWQRNTGTGDTGDLLHLDKDGTGAGTCLNITNEGTGSDIVAPNFLLRNGTLTHASSADAISTALTVQRNSVAVGRIDNNGSSLRVQSQNNNLQLRNLNNRGLDIHSDDTINLFGAITSFNLTGAVLTGGRVDITSNGLSKEVTLGETVTAGQIVHLHTDGKYYLAEADIPADAVDELVLALAGGVLDGVVAGLVFGYYTTTSLTAGSIYYLSETAGAITATAPTTSLSVVRILGYALSTTVLLFRPDTSFVELA